MRSSDKKKTQGGYNTDDLIRDSESEVDLDKVSSILQDAQLNLKDGLNFILSQNNQSASNISNNTSNPDERTKMEELAMRILQS